MVDFKDRVCLVTGGAGFIGSHIVDRLMNEGAIVRVIDDLSNGSEDNFRQWNNHERFEFIKGDLRNRDAVKPAVNGVSVVFHQAAKVSVPASVKDPYLSMDVNVMGTTTLLDECRLQDVEKFVVASSSSIYGDPPTSPKVETMPTLPISPYAVSKLAQENLSLSFSQTYGLNSTALRYFNVYGPRQRGGAYAGVISIFRRKALAGEDLPIYDDGQQSRDFTYINDVVETNIQVVRSLKTAGKAYNVGRGEDITVEKLAAKIIKISHSTSGMVFLPARVGDVRDSLASTEKLLTDTGYAPRTSVQEGLEKTFSGQ
ncbi:MAG: SDR family NAD(P)-dependent oxidoreductase [Candidatus Thorarchaeota archaeon]